MVALAASVVNGLPEDWLIRHAAGGLLGYLAGLYRRPSDVAGLHLDAGETFALNSGIPSSEIAGARLPLRY